MPTKLQKLVARKNRENAHDPHYYKWGPNRTHYGTNIPLPRVKEIWYGQALPTFAEGLAMLNLIFNPRERPAVRDVWPVLADDPINSTARSSRCNNGIIDDGITGTIRNRRRHLSPNTNHA